MPTPGPGRAVSERDRREARARLSAAQRAGCFGTSDLYEERLEALAAASTDADLEAIVGDLPELLTDHARAQVLAVVRDAHVQGRLGPADFDERTERCLGPLTRADAELVVSDLGYRVEHRVPPRRVRRLVSRCAPAVGAGVLCGAAVLVAPAGLGVPVEPWVPLAAGVGVFAAAFAALLRLAVGLRGRLARTLVVGGPAEAGREAGPPRRRRRPGRVSGLPRSWRGSPPS